MTIAEYTEVIAGFRGIEISCWQSLDKLSKMRLKRMKPQRLEAKIAGAVLGGDNFVGLWPSLCEIPF